MIVQIQLLPEPSVEKGLQYIDLLQMGCVLTCIVGGRSCALDKGEKKSHDLKILGRFMKKYLPESEVLQRSVCGYAFILIYVERNCQIHC